MEIWSTVAQWSPGVAFGMACLYFFNFIVTKFLQDKGEWNAALEKLLNRYDTRVIESTTALVNAANQDHHLRGEMQKDMVRRDTQFATIIDLLRSIDNRSRGGSDD